MSQFTRKSAPRLPELERGGGVVVVFRRASGRGIYASDHAPAADYRDIDSLAVSAAGAANPATVLTIALMLYAHRLP